jgi:hypothetical protein
VIVVAREIVPADRTSQAAKHALCHSQLGCASRFASTLPREKLPINRRAVMRVASFVPFVATLLAVAAQSQSSIEKRASPCDSGAYRERSSG